MVATENSCRPFGRSPYFAGAVAGNCDIEAAVVRGGHMQYDVTTDPLNSIANCQIRGTLA